MPDRIPPEVPSRPKYRWPWFVLGAVVLAILLAIVWMSGEVRRTRQIRDANSPGQRGQAPPEQTAGFITA